MEITKCHIQGLLTIEPKVFGDNRGYFFESFNKDKFDAEVPNISFVQDNQSMSHKGVLRGLHFQRPPFEQGKLVRVIQGSVLDVAVDIRSNSITYGQHVAIELNGSNNTMFYIPPGFAHGFLTLEDNTIFAYKCTQYYHKDSEGCILWNSPSLGINWGINSPILSEKDKIAKDFSNFESPF